MRCGLFWNQVTLGDFDFFLFRVPAELDGFHAIAKRRLNWIQHVRCGNEHHVGKVERHTEIVIPEGEILLRVEDFE